MNTIDKSNYLTFEDLRQIDENGEEVWYARALSKLLGYSDFRNFLTVIEKAKKSCINSGNKVSKHLGDIAEVVEIGSGAKAQYPSFKLSRYSCYLKSNLTLTTKIGK
jgi:DNA-damage-inducible protein D